ncbi:MAG: L-methionine (R)-S-oxide reductase [Kiritimatiellia bacterium]|jgi:L-methionine (R)-S-oxide reductase
MEDRMTKTDLFTQSWLEGFLARHDGAAGTVHVRRPDALHLVASSAIPESVVRATQTIPIGKGMAGLAWQRERPIQTCNLHDDTTGDVRPGAKAVNAQAAIALPVFNHDGEVRAVVGIAWMHSNALDRETIVRLTQDASVAPYVE